MEGIEEPPTPQALSAVLRSHASQFHLLLEPYELSLPSDTVLSELSGEGHAFQEVQLDAAGGGPMLAKLGWELKRDQRRGWWHGGTCQTAHSPWAWALRGLGSCASVGCACLPAVRGTALPEGEIRPVVARPIASGGPG